MGKVLCEFDAEGREILDNTPVEMPLNYKEPPSIQDMIRQAIRIEMSQQAAAQGMESFEEADDFAVDDDDDFVSPYQLSEMQEEIPLPVRQEKSDNGKDSQSAVERNRSGNSNSESERLREVDGASKQSASSGERSESAAGVRASGGVAEAKDRAS